MKVTNKERKKNEFYKKKFRFCLGWRKCRRVISSDFEKKFNDSFNFTFCDDNCTYFKFIKGKFLSANKFMLKLFFWTVRDLL